MVWDGSLRVNSSNDLGSLCALTNSNEVASRVSVRYVEFHCVVSLSEWRLLLAAKANSSK